MASDRRPRPCGRFTPASQVSRTLGRAGYKPWQTALRNTTSFSGYRCSWMQAIGATFVHWGPGDDLPDDRVDAETDRMTGEYTEVLEAAGYKVERRASSLIVWPKEK